MKYAGFAHGLQRTVGEQDVEGGDGRAHSGFPPNVVAWVPGANPDATVSVHPMAPMGTPLPSALATVTMSGAIPACS